MARAIINFAENLMCRTLFAPLDAGSPIACKSWKHGNNRKSAFPECSIFQPMATDFAGILSPVNGACMVNSARLLILWKSYKSGTSDFNELMLRTKTLPHCSEQGFLRTTKNCNMFRDLRSVFSCNTISANSESRIHRPIDQDRSRSSTLENQIPCHFLFYMSSQKLGQCGPSLQ